MGRRAHGQPVVRDRQRRHHFAPFVPHSCALCYPTRAVTSVLLSADARRMLIGACNLMVGPNFEIGASGRAIRCGLRPRTVRQLRHSFFWTRFSRIVRSVPLPTRRVMCSTWCPLHDSWALIAATIQYISPGCGGGGFFVLGGACAKNRPTTISRASPCATGLSHSPTRNRSASRSKPACSRPGRAPTAPKRATRSGSAMSRSASGTGSAPRAGGFQRRRYVSLAFLSLLLFFSFFWGGWV